MSGISEEQLKLENRRLLREAQAIHELSKLALIVGTVFVITAVSIGLAIN